MELNIKFDEKILIETANRVLDEYEYNGKTIREWADLIANPKTNADRIRSMTDEELANELAVIADCSCCNHRNEMDDCSLVDYSCQNQWLDWLREEAE